MQKFKFRIIGGGKLYRSLAVALLELGKEVVTISTRREDNTSALKKNIQDTKIVSTSGYK